MRRRINGDINVKEDVILGCILWSREELVIRERKICLRGFY